MKTLDIQINKTKKNNIFSVKMDLNKLETLAASFGFFNPDFLKSIKKAESDYKAGRIRKIKSLKEIM